MPRKFGIPRPNHLTAEGLRAWRDREIEVIRSLGEQIGFGNMMDLASRIWAEDVSGGAFVVGPAKALTVECGCESPKGCDWCCGTGWLTKHVKSVKDQDVE